MGFSALRPRLVRPAGIVDVSKALHDTFVTLLKSRVTNVKSRVTNVS